MVFGCVFGGFFGVGLGSKMVMLGLVWCCFHGGLVAILVVFEGFFDGVWG